LRHVNAYRHEPLAPRGPGRDARRTSLWVLAVVLVAGLELCGVLATPGAAGPPAGVPSHSLASLAPAPAALPAAGTTHGDLNVTSGETFYIPGPLPPSVPSTYYQGGNITVQSGGTLIVQNVTLSFVQFVGDIGTPLARLSHVLKFVVRAGGTAIFRNATLTTDTFSVNPYVKLDIVDDGVLTFWQSSIQTPGFLNVGATGDLTLNVSAIGPNPAVSNVVLGTTTVNDLAFAPTLNLTGGATANLFSSVYRDLYADNLFANGAPDPLPINSVQGVAPGSVQNVWTTPTDPGSLIQDYLYPAGISGGSITLQYTDTNTKLAGNTTLSVTLNYAGTPYGLGSFLFVYGVNGTLVLPFPAGLPVQVAGTGGMMGWLNRTGDFSTPVGISLSYSGSGPGITMNATLQPYAPVNFGTVASGAGTTLNTVNSYIGLDFAAVGSEPWFTHQLTLTNGASAYLGNLTVQGQLQNGTQQVGLGAIVPDATSNAYLYRWAEVHTFGLGGSLPVPNATVSVTYAYNASQLDNHTANSLNNLSTTDRAVWGYLQYWDSAHGVPAYGKSGADGIVSVLVASNDIYGASAPDGDYLGDYHVTLTPPAGSGAPQGFTALISSYPEGVANGSVGYGVADTWGTFAFPLYFAGAGVSAHNGIVVTANNRTTNVVLIGMELGVAVNVSDNGPAPIRSLEGTLVYNTTSGVVISTVSKTVDLFAPTQNATIRFAWKVNDTVTGLHGTTVDDNLSISIVWNHDLPSEGGGSFSTLQEIKVQPSNVTLTGITFPSTSFTSGQTYSVTGHLVYNGSQAATVEVIAWAAAGGGGPIVLASRSVAAAAFEGHPVFFSLSWTPDQLTVGKGYRIAVIATYNSVVANVTSGNVFSIPAPPVTHFLYEKILGLPLWMWLVIAAAIVAAAVGFLLFSRQRAAGKLVECGECGNLVPEDSKVCPKCGAEFETDVVRCSRCSSTIPANSRYCPECAAQLLGKPDEGGPDPERQAYADFTERYRAEGKKELGENYSEGSFWDWWKRQPSYTPFSQWKTQQGQGTPRAGMSAPPPGGSPPPRGGGAAPARPAARRPAPPPTRPPSSSAAPAAVAAGAGATAPPPAPAAAAPGALKPCPNCGKEIPPEYLVCPFCGSVTQ
jgi:RNA polymerase subunit RPABC4/transcription elongation factor Spt4